MKNKLFKKTITITLILCMILLQFQPSFAIKVNNNLDNISASSDIAILKKYNIISEDYII